jgi:hypothetical protein
MTPTELAEALKVATGPSFVLDREMHLLFYPNHPPEPGKVRAINPTASVDTAMTLLPAAASSWALAASPDGICATVMTGDRSTLAYGATPALALCLAILHHHIAAEGRNIDHG